MREQVAKIVAAYVRRNSIGLSEMPALIQWVSQSLAGLGQQPAAAPPAAPTPAVPIRRSITADKITCLECGWSGQMLRRHLTAHGTNPEDYRARWNLAANYPMTSKNYSAHRSDISKAFGFGVHRRTRHNSRK
jgi:predicted transcriptional regulator